MSEFSFSKSFQEAFRWLANQFKLYHNMIQNVSSTTKLGECSCKFRELACPCQLSYSNRGNFYSALILPENPSFSFLKLFTQNSNGWQSNSIEVFHKILLNASLTSKDFPDNVCLYLNVFIDENCPLCFCNQGRFCTEASPLPGKTFFLD